jgi:hypothetical protein
VGDDTVGEGRHGKWAEGGTRKNLPKIGQYRLPERLKMTPCKMGISKSAEIILLADGVFFRDSHAG